MSNRRPSRIRPTRPTLPPPSKKVYSLGGSMFIHNALEFDYCITEALESLHALCDDVVILDAQSTDGTIDVLRELKKKLPKLRLVEGAKWDCAPNFERLRILANEARSLLRTDWHFMLQADEVIHEDSFPHIREAINSRSGKEGYFCRRLNFFGDYNHYIKIHGPHENKPCGDQIVRLATINKPAIGDAETIGTDYPKTGLEYMDKIRIFHYGLVREDAKAIKKIISMQTWFWGPTGIPDPKVVEMDKKGDGVFDWTILKTKDMFDKLEGSHPRFARKYVEERQAKKPIKVE